MTGDGICTINFPKKSSWVIPRLMVLSILLLFISSCQSGGASFRPPKLDEIEEFINNQEAALIVDELLDDSSVLLYQSSNTYGYYILTIKEPEALVVLNQVAVAKNEEPILIFGHLSGDHPFIIVVIQDKTLADETTAIEVSIDSQNILTATTNKQAGAILISPAAVNDWRTVKLFNAQGEILYKQKGYP